MKKVIIVEGKNDAHRIKQIYPSSIILTTNGSAVSDEFLALVKKVSLDNEVLLLLDPDYPGEYIRKKLLKVVPNAKNLFVQKKDAISKNKKKVGVEHVSLDILKNVIDNPIASDYHKNISFLDLVDLGLTGEGDSKKKREKLCANLGIGYVNAKQLVNRLNLFNITLDDIKEII